MKTLKSLFAIAMFSLTITTSSFASVPDASPDATIRDRVIELIKQPYFAVESTTVAHVEFRINSAGEFVVLNVETDDSDVDKYVKSRLNYRSVDQAEYKTDMSYFIDLRFEEKR